MFGIAKDTGSRFILALKWMELKASIPSGECEWPLHPPWYWMSQGPQCHMVSTLFLHPDKYNILRANPQVHMAATTWQVLAGWLLQEVHSGLCRDEQPLDWPDVKKVLQIGPCGWGSWHFRGSNRSSVVSDIYIQYVSLPFSPHCWWVDRKNWGCFATGVWGSQLSGAVPQPKAI